MVLLEEAIALLLVGGPVLLVGAQRVMELSKSEKAATLEGRSQKWEGRGEGGRDGDFLSKWQGPHSQKSYNIFKVENNDIFIEHELHFSFEPSKGSQANLRAELCQDTM